MLGGFLARIRKTSAQGQVYGEVWQTEHYGISHGAAWQSLDEIGWLPNPCCSVAVY